MLFYDGPMRKSGNLKVSTFCTHKSTLHEKTDLPVYGSNKPALINVKPSCPYPAALYLDLEGENVKLDVHPDGLPFGDQSLSQKNKISLLSRRIHAISSSYRKPPWLSGKCGQQSEFLSML